MDESTMEARSRRIRFSSTVSESVVLDVVMSEGLLQAAEGYWKEKGLAVKRVRKFDNSIAQSEPVEMGFTAEGGTIWTADFELYKKTVTICLTGRGLQTEVLVQLVLPGGLMSLQDREKAADLIGSFHDALRRYKPQ